VQLGFTCTRAVLRGAAGLARRPGFAPTRHPAHGALLAAVLSLGAATPAGGHDPAQHGFQMVGFE